MENFKQEFLGEPYESYRGTGRSLSMAFEYISKAMQRENKTINIVDHHHTRMANEHLTNMIGEIIMKLDLKGFEIKSRSSIIFKGFSVFNQD